MSKKKLYTEEELKERKKQWNAEHKEYYAAWHVKRRNTKLGRARMLLGGYKKEDKNQRRITDIIQENYITAEWIVDNIFTKPCTHCGESDWRKIGCNRLDNSKPHTMDNVEPCCKECNDKLAKLERQKIVDQINKETGEVVKTWGSTKEAAKALHLNETSINRCCAGGYFDYRKNKWININQSGGFLWKRHKRG